MFETYDEAADMNSKCSFCGKDKFKIIAKDGKYDLERCPTEKSEYCEWNHSAPVVQLQLADRDTVAIVSGWV